MSQSVTLKTVEYYARVKGLFNLLKGAAPDSRDLKREGRDYGRGRRKRTVRLHAAPTRLLNARALALLTETTFLQINFFLRSSRVTIKIKGNGSERAGRE